MKIKTLNSADPLTGVGTNPKKEIVRVISPFVAGSNPALGTSMGFWNKPATLLLPFPEELEIIHVADIFESIFNQLLNFIERFCHLTCMRASVGRWFESYRRHQCGLTFLFGLVFCTLKQRARNDQICRRSVTCSRHIVQNGDSKKSFDVHIVRKRF